MFNLKRKKSFVYFLLLFIAIFILTATYIPFPKDSAEAATKLGGSPADLQGDFIGDGRDELLKYSNGKWEFGYPIGASTLWYSVRSTNNFGNLEDGRPFWVGDFNGDGKDPFFTLLLLYIDNNRTKTFGTYKDF
ncbi:hypothetical protein [Metabacillus rhizolycopersici]|uniref:VCBS repeat-containing protein n=1 Tax=Metabacillus rhizolycopersici TaxID=2875709 RepID=A0ABS7UWD4_9BACI|nr:hypothetical protein [Metabacillus rhizolycopersici]MBZ5752611.1 hypothetical protein [Metabacillus rhizolycopersici]